MRPALASVGSDGRSAPGRAGGPPSAPARRALSLLNRPLTSYYLILGCTVLLLLIGLAMVLSTSSASQLDSGLSPYGVFVKQLIGVLIGLAMMWVLAKSPPRLLRAFAFPMYLAAMAGLVLVLAFGTTAYGAERWIRVAGIQLQPSEFAKLAFLLWGADLLARKDALGQLRDWRALLVPLLPGAAVIGVLVLAGHDIGTTFLLLVILLALLWVIGTPGRLFVVLVGLVLFALLLVVVTTKYAESRLTGFLNPGGNPTGPNQQAIEGKQAIGSGGLFGVGLGDSKMKWGWVPEAGNDFIFAILGEELGLIGTVCVVLLYGGLAYAGLRVARRMTEPFMRLAAVGATAWIVVQALVNICAVVGLLPITGVPLPLISAGLSSLLATMAAIGMLLSFARREPGAPEALAAARPNWLARVARSVGLGRLRSADRPAPARPGRPPGPQPGRTVPDPRPGEPQARTVPAPRPGGPRDRTVPAPRRGPQRT
jgi:cell division protein FtsW